MKGQNGVCDRSMCWPLVRTAIESVDVGVFSHQQWSTGHESMSVRIESVRLQSPGPYAALEKKCSNKLKSIYSCLAKTPTI